MAVFLLLLSKSASTASCNILFSFLNITSGAFISISCFNRLFLIIIRRYKSFRSDAANLPPSSGTSGRNSGGITGNMDTTIHSGLFILLLTGLGTKDCTTFNLFKASPLFCFDFDVFTISTNSFFKSIIFNLDSISFIASPPMVA